MRWEETADDDAACAREADLIVVMEPRYNKSIVGAGRWTVIAVDGLHQPTRRLRFELTTDPSPGAEHAYGCFPHLGPDVASRPGTACSDGYTALLRLLWATSQTADRERYPKSVTRFIPPPVFDVVVRPEWHKPVHAFLSGRSVRLLDLVAAAVQSDEVAPYLRTALVRDLAAARELFTFGPAAVRRLRLRHHLPSGVVTRETTERLLRDELGFLQHA